MNQVVTVQTDGVLAIKPPALSCPRPQLGVSGPMVGFRAGGGALNGQSLPTSLEVLRSSFRSARNDSPSLASRSDRRGSDREGLVRPSR